MNRGIHAANRGLMNISTAMTDEDVNVAIKTLTEVLLYLKPHVQTDYAHLLK